LGPQKSDSEEVTKVMEGVDMKEVIMDTASLDQYILSRKPITTLTSHGEYGIRLGEDMGITANQSENNSYHPQSPFYS